MRTLFNYKFGIMNDEFMNDEFMNDEFMNDEFMKRAIL